MTVTEVCNSLIEFYAKHDVFILDKNLRDVITIPVDDKESKALVLAALKEMEKMEIIKASEQEGQTYYFLQRPLQMCPQQVTLNFPLNTVIAQLINDTAKAVGDKYVADALNIKQNDLEIVLGMALSKNKND